MISSWLCKNTLNIWVNEAVVQIYVISIVIRPQCEFERRYINPCWPLPSFDFVSVESKIMTKPDMHSPLALFIKYQIFRNSSLPGTFYFLSQRDPSYHVDTVRREREY